MANDARPIEIADDLLYRTGKALLTGDFDAFLCCFRLPNIIETVEGKRLVGSAEEMRRTFDGVRHIYETKGVVDLARTVVSAEFVEPDVIGSTHVSVQLQRDGEPLNTPYPVYSVLRQGKGIWKIESSIYVIFEESQLSKTLADRDFKSRC